MASSNSQIAKLQCGHPKRAGLPDVNINTGAQGINTERELLLSTLLSGQSGQGNVWIQESTRFDKMKEVPFPNSSSVI